MQRVATAAVAFLEMARFMGTARATRMPSSGRRTRGWYRPRMRWVRAGAASCLLLILMPREASGHGRFPEANQILFSPADPSRVLTRTTFALLPSTDDGATWSYLCLESLGLSSLTLVDPALAFTANGTLAAGLNLPTGGLSLSSSLGCDWTCAGGPLVG